VISRADGDATTDVGGGDGDGKPCTHVCSFRDGSARFWAGGAVRRVFRGTRIREVQGRRLLGTAIRAVRGRKSLG
jgi:hypothetical protein